MTALQHLNIGNNALGDDGALQLAAGIQVSARHRWSLLQL
jgi:hypothetical protein